MHREKKETDKNYVVIRFEEGTCSARVGMSLRGGQQPVTLGGDHCFDASVIHEFLHSFGIKHEQARPDRNDYVSIHFEYVKEKYKHNFNICTGCSTFNLPYDGKSLMHYSAYAFTIDYGIPTIESKVGTYYVGSI